jgi:hypothetical protein
MQGRVALRHLEMSATDTPGQARWRPRTNPSRHPICITGMGRCGTSLTTAIIGLMGVDLGPTETMLSANPDDNARGYWEQHDIYEINEQILHAFGGTWANPPELSQGWERSPALDGIRDQARDSLTTLFGAGNPRWAWKDPRASVTLPFWRELIGNMDYVLCVRNPADVAASLAKRDNEDLDFEDSVALWLRYLRAALESTDKSRRLILRYEDYFTDTERQIERLTEFVCGPGTQLSDETYDRVVGFIDPKLWHNRDPSEGAARIREVSPEAADLYAHLATRTPILQSLPAPDKRHQSLLAGWSVNRVWLLAFVLSSLVAAIDAVLNHVILIPLLAAGPICCLLTGRWVRTATVGIWTIILAILLGVPDEIWGTHVQLVYLGFVIVVSLLSISTATVIEKGNSHTL